jgi:uncharacterized protein
MGVYDPPDTSHVSSGGVVICAPFGHEYVRSYRALRNLAADLAAAGLHVLRFDYTGCGDSAGEAQDATVEQWQQDVASAIDELKDMSALPRVSIVGVRFGATLAAMATSTRKDIDTLAVWDPVVRGSNHLEELRDLQRRWLRGRPKPQLPPGWPQDGEIIGFPVPPALEAGFMRADLGALPAFRCRRLIAVTSSEQSDAHWRGHLESLSQPCVYEQVACDCEWGQPRAVHLALHATDIVERIAGFFRITRPA